MLKKPWCGWSEVCIGEFSRQCSYLTNPVYDLSKFFLDALCYIDAAVHFNAEDLGTFDLVYTGSLYVVLHEDEPKIIYLDIDIKELAAEFIKDIKENLVDWANWESIDNEDEEIENIREALEPIENFLNKEHLSILRIF